MKHQRHTIFFLLTAAGLLYDQYALFFNQLTSFLKTDARDKLHAALSAVERICSVLIICWLVVMLSWDIAAGRARLIIDPRLYPIGSFAFIKQNQLEGNLAVTYNWGSDAFVEVPPSAVMIMEPRGSRLIQLICLPCNVPALLRHPVGQDLFTIQLHISR